jgi:hypothetical protein
MKLIKILLQLASIGAVIYGVKYETGLMQYDARLLADPYNVAMESR